jgi:hypothetical protein
LATTGFVQRGFIFSGTAASPISIMADGPVSVREKKFLRNPLLQRKQFVLEVTHPGKANLSRTELKAQLTKVWAPLSMFTDL